MSDNVLTDALTRSQARRRLPPPTMRRALRERAAVSQAAIAQAVGTSPAAVSRWESGERSPRGVFLLRYLNVLKRLERETLFSLERTKPQA